MTHVTLLTSHREGVEVLMADLQVPTDEFSYGRSKIFIRNPRTVENTVEVAHFARNIYYSQSSIQIQVLFEHLKSWVKCAQQS